MAVVGGGNKRAAAGFMGCPEMVAKAATDLCIGLGVRYAHKSGSLSQCPDCADIPKIDKPLSPPALSQESDKLALNACPFCGCLAAIREDHWMFGGAPGYRVECEGDCHAMTCWWHTLEQATDNWNRRPVPSLPITHIP